MLTRRAFLTGACCLLHAGPPLASERTSQAFVCATPDVEVRKSGARPRLRATLHPPEIWRLDQNYDSSKGIITLHVGFVGGTKGQKAMVRDIASEWLREGVEKYIRLVFGTAPARSHIRVAFDPKGGNVSAIGALALRIDGSKPTMNLEPGLTGRAIRHEFGHALGLRHEHHHPAANIVWNRDAVFEQYRRFGWSDAKIEKNVFERFDTSHSCHGSAFDPASVMLYPFDKELTLNGVGAEPNEDISSGDRRCLVRAYSARARGRRSTMNCAGVSDV